MELNTAVKSPLVPPFRLLLVPAALTIVLTTYTFSKAYSGGWKYN